MASATDSVGLEVVVDAVADDLRFVATTRKTLKEKDGSDAPPRYVWERVSIDDSKHKTQPVNGGPQKYLQEDAHNVAIHCWGESPSDAQRLRNALVKSLRTLLLGRRYDVLTARWTEPEWAQSGYVLTVAVTIYLLLPDVVIPRTGPSSPEETHAPPTETVIDNRARTTTIDESDIDTTGGTTGDGIIEAGDP